MGKPVQRSAVSTSTYRRQGGSSRKTRLVKEENDKCMTWREKQRTRVPAIDVGENPFCVERRVNEERNMMQLNRNPSLGHLTSADVRRTASFVVDDEKPVRDLARKKRQLLAWSLRTALPSSEGTVRDNTIDPQSHMIAGMPDNNISPQSPVATAVRKTHTIPNLSSSTYGFGDAGAAPDNRSVSNPGRRWGRGDRKENKDDVDLDTIPNLEPYRMEVAAQQPITFGHRPLSASRMFNPSTMATSCHRDKDSGRADEGRGKGGRDIFAGRRRITDAKRKTLHSQKLTPSSRVNGLRRHASGLSAPMLKELLRWKGDGTEHGTAKPVTNASYSLSRVNGAGIASMTAPSAGTTLEIDGDVYFQQTAEKVTRTNDNDHSGLAARYGSGERYYFSGDSFSEASNPSLCQSVVVDPSGGRGGFRGGLEAATCLTRSSSLDDSRRRRQHSMNDGVVRGLSIEKEELRRIFSSNRPPWDGTPAPLPAPREVRRAVSLLLMPDPDERLRDKLARSRKAAAGYFGHEKEGIAPPPEPQSGRWESSPPTPRTVIASQEVKRLGEARRKRDDVMARRVRRAQLSVFYKKIAGAERQYRSTLVRGLKQQGVEAATFEAAETAAAAAAAQSRGLRREFVTTS